MKRKNDDEDLHPAKRANVEEINGLLKKATEAYNSQYMSSGLTWGNMAYALDDTNMKARFLLGMSSWKLRKFQDAIFMLTAFSRDFDFQKHNLNDFVVANFALGQTHIEVGDVGSGINMMKVAAQWVQKDDGKFHIFSALGYHYGLHGNEEEAGKWSMRAVSVGNKFIKFDDRKKMNQYRRAYATAFGLEELNLVTDIYDYAPGSIENLLNDAYVNWNMLPPVYQRHVRETCPVEYKRMVIFSEAMKFVMDNVNAPFTDDCIGDIHSFLYKV